MNILFYLTTMAIYTCINGILTLGLNMQFGLAGILNLAFIVLVAVGAYCTGIAALPPAPAAGAVHYIGGFGWAFPWDLLFGMLVTVAFACLLGLICFKRIAHWYLALTLSSIGWALLILVSNDANLFNGQTGLIGIPGPWQDQLSPFQYQFVVLAMCVVALAGVFILFSRIEHSPLGRGFRALREDELAAGSLAKNPLRLRMIAFLLGAGAAGLGGGLSAIYFGGWNDSAWQPGETFVIL
ncbi:MAG TPA: branched-chain amino acid ABC transporter permease, partial [Chloroflexota bacterium]|nr:branched-chain amino acid ABC transporter permease [Chloroflexota bacterium]